LEQKAMSDKSDEIAGAVLARIFSAAAQPTEADHARALDMTIRAMARDRYTNPNRLIPEAQMQRENVKPAGAPMAAERGWAAERPLPVHSAKGSREEALIDGLARKFVGGPNNEKK
jgi:hypothetical protein